MRQLHTDTHSEASLQWKRSHQSRTLVADCARLTRAEGGSWRTLTAAPRVIGATQ